MRLRDLLLSQFHASPRLRALIDQAGDIHTRWMWMLKRIFLMSDIDTATGHWLDVIGKIVGRQRYIQGLRKNYFGFSENQDESFDQAPFWSGYPDSIIYTGIADDQLYRKLLWAQVVYNRGNVSIAGLTRGLSRVFDGATVQVTENGDARVRVRIGRRLDRDEKTLLKRMPICVGAGIEVIVDDVPFWFGFSEQRYYGFDVGPFWTGEGTPSRNASISSVQSAFTAAKISVN